MLDSNTKGLKALHRILIEARLRALRGADAKELANILDYAEILPVYMLDEDDKTTEFQTQIAGLGQEVPELAGLSRDYEANNL